jgi:hypothetical protein
MTRAYRLDTFGVFSLTAEKKKNSSPKVGPKASTHEKRKSMKEGGLFQQFIAEETEAVLAELAAEKAERVRQLEAHYFDDNLEDEDSSSLQMN